MTSTTTPDAMDQSPAHSGSAKLPWNAMGCIQLVYHKNALGKDERLDLSDISLLVGQMMFAYGDHSLPDEDSKQFVMHTVRIQLQNMLLECSGKRSDIQEITYANVIIHLLQRCPVRLRRLVRYLMAVERKTSDIDRVVPKGSHEKGDYLLNDLRDPAPSSVICFRRSCPLIYGIMRQYMTDAQMEFFTARMEPASDTLHYRMKDPLRRRRHVLSDDDWEHYKAAKRVSFCSRSGRKSAFRAHKFHELLMFPPLQTDLIFILDFLGKEILREMVFYASELREVERRTDVVLRPLEFYPQLGTVCDAMARRWDEKTNLERKPIYEAITRTEYEQGLAAMMDAEQSGIILEGKSFRILPSLGHSMDPIKTESELSQIEKSRKQQQEFHRFYAPLDRKSRSGVIGGDIKTLRFPLTSHSVDTEVAFAPIARMLNGTQEVNDADLYDIDREVRRQQEYRPMPEGPFGSHAA